MTRIAFLVFLSASVAACAGADPTAGTTESNLAVQGDHGAPPPDARGVQWAKDAGGHSKSSSPVLIDHHGIVAADGTYVEAIYWGASWSNSSFVGDKQTGLATFYQGLGNSSYAGTNSEYTEDVDGRHVSTAVTYGGSHVDTSAAAKNGGRTSVILAEACAQASKLVPNGYYPVYVDSPRGHSSYCAWHSTGTCPDGTQIQIGFFYNLDNDPGCDPQDSSGNHSQGLAALANVSGHEYSEMVTDTHLDAWYASSGEENADECAWTFGSSLLKFSNNSQWKVQGNFSNAAYSASSGYDGAGCIDGN